MESDSPVSRGRRRLGLILLGVSILPWLAMLAVPTFELDAAGTALILGALGVGAEGIAAVAVVLLGREAYDAIRRKLSLASLLRRRSDPSPETTEHDDRETPAGQGLSSGFPARYSPVQDEDA